MTLGIRKMAAVTLKYDIADLEIGVPQYVKPTSSFQRDNPSLQVTADKRIEMVSRPIQRPGKGDVLIHVKAVGICGSDIHFWKTGQIGDLKVEGNCVLGHEISGQIVEIGEGVTSVQIGDRVAVEPQVPCGECFLCMQGDYNLCDTVAFSGVYPTHGGLQRYKVHPAKFVHKLPDNMSYIQGSIVEPVSVAYHGIERAGIELGRGALILGAGPIGLATLLLAKASGATPLVITDISESRLRFAQKIVPEVKTYTIPLELSSRQNATNIRELFGPTEYEAPPVVFECTGVESSIITGCYAARRSGTLMIIGVGRGTINNFPFMHLSLAEIDVKFINRYHDSWPAVIRLISQNVINVNELVSHRFPLENAVEAFHTCVDPKSESVKIIIEA